MKVWVRVGVVLYCALLFAIAIFIVLVGAVSAAG
jgi:hypothetical protein